MARLPGALIWAKRAICRSWGTGQGRASGKMSAFIDRIRRTDSRVVFLLEHQDGDCVFTAADAPVFFLGLTGDVPLLGDWNGDGRTKVGSLLGRPMGCSCWTGTAIWRGMVPARMARFTLRRI